MIVNRNLLLYNKIGDNMFQVLEDKTVYKGENGDIFGVVTYPKISSNTVDVNHTFVDPKMRGKGLASELLSHAFQYFKENNLQAKCSCFYAKKWIKEHSEYQDIIISSR